MKKKKIILIIVGFSLGVLIVYFILNRPKSLTRKHPDYFFKDERVVKLCDAISDGNEKEVDRLLKEGVDINTVGKDGMNPLLWALSMNDTKTYEMVLKKGGDPNIKITAGSGTGSSVMATICRAKKDDFLRLTLKYGWKPDSKDLRSYGLLLEAVKNLSIEKVKLLVEAGVDVNQKYDGETPMNMAGMLNQFDIVHYLLQNGADPTIKSDHGMSIVYLIEKSYHCMDRSTEAYKYLLKSAEFLREKGMKIDFTKYDPDNKKKKKR